MSNRSLNDPFNPEADLRHGAGCTCSSCGGGEHAQHDHGAAPAEQDANQMLAAKQGVDKEAMFDRAVESAVVRALFGHHDASRRFFLKAVGAGTFAAAVGSIFPLDAAKAMLKDNLGDPEKRDLTVGFVPITCATPIIMAHPMGFYERYGLNVDLRSTAGWAVARDMSMNREYDASHMLTPMPLAMTMGTGSSSMPFIMPAVENINGQAITLHNKHKDKRDPSQWKGFRFAVPFDFSMHNFLLRYYVAEHGLDPDRDIQIRVLPPPEMVANLRAGNVDGYLAPDPFNQRAVWEEVGFIHLLTKEIWDGHPCCAFATSRAFAEEYPNSFGALFKAIVDATHYASEHENRAEISEAIAPRNYLNQPVSVIQQVLTGRYADGLGNVKEDPDRIDFDPFPWHSMAVWIMTQMKRWGYVDGDVDYKGIAEEVYLATDCGKLMRELGYEPPEVTYKSHMIMGKAFDPEQPEAYVDSFEIRRS
ncbi:CmpA/NrtA family ABC transporter substrate-binding protein [Alkalilimnicola ehrlichii MLHE-1]|uniref:Putative nitrate transporter component n=1 Tax=Alkalilimnicola ehrlichii (strain ATCC BAA-1101 / DSM 17681 / MLHE-1) TaxID=187272 RepID=Q0A5F8_ALKEH|nr:CmpA/NrtA family ABC transporter substrate-binding protein [Alkalilimnicola ehrlichii]ABI57929.1 putative nitrate transporter component [Alkalilimnicola ehrlichii MLHE-1]